MNTLPVHLFRDSFKPFLTLLNENKVRYQLQSQRAGIFNGPGVLEIIQALGPTAMWGALATVIVTYIKSRRGRKVVITMQDNTVVQAEGLSMSELEQVLKHAQNLTVIEAKSQSTDFINEDNGE